MVANLWRNLVGAALVYGIAAVVLLVIFLVAREYGVAFFELTRDPFAGQADTIPVYTSILSNLGIVVWCFTIAAQLFSAWVARRIKPGGQLARFLFAAGLITLVLMLDDLLMLHERLDHTVETVMYGAYGISVGIVLLRFRQVIFSSNFLILGVALVCFGVSMVLDNILTQLSIRFPYDSVLEDAFKIIGIVGWASYFMKLAMESVMDTVGYATS